MIKTLCLLALLCSTALVSQNFEVQDGQMTDYLVYEMDASQEQLYNKTINFIKKTYANPDEVLEMTIANEEVRFTGGSSGNYCQYILGTRVCQDLDRYTISILFKEGKVKFNPLSFESYFNTTQYSYGGWMAYGDDLSTFYNRKGKLKRQTRDIPDAIAALYTDIFNSYTEYLKNGDVSQNDTGW